MDNTRAPHAVAIASIMHESNSFNPEATTLADFQFLEGNDPAETLRLWSKGDTEVAGMLAEVTRCGVTALPIVYTGATPKGRVTAEAFETLCNRVLDGLTKIGHFDGVLLALHGAMCADGYPHADEEVVRRVRAAVGPDMPIVVTHDFHANIPPGLASLCNALVVYQQNPHVDTKSRGARAASILVRMLNGEVNPQQVIVKPSLLWNIAFQSTSQEPLKAVTDASIELENSPKVLAASVAGGYQYCDVPYMGPTVVVVTDGDLQKAEQESNNLAGMLWERREATRLNLPDAARAVKEAMESDRFPVALFEVGDNIGGGAPGDETTILGELLRQKASGWVAVIYDPEAVRAAKEAGLEGAFDREVGGRSQGVRSSPVRVEGRVRSLHTGRYVETAVRHGGQRYWNMGHTAVIEVAGSTADDLSLLVVTAERSSPNSLHQLISCGIYPERQKILVAKGTVAPRAAYEPVAARIVLVDTPGVTAVNPAHFEFEHANSELWGLRP